MYEGQDFDGETIVPEIDNPRLGTQINRVFKAIKDGSWYTLAVIAEATGAPESSVSARLRDLRKKKFGGHTIDRERVKKSGLYIYRLAA